MKNMFHENPLMVKALSFEGITKFLAVILENRREIGSHLKGLWGGFGGGADRKGSEMTGNERLQFWFYPCGSPPWLDQAMRNILLLP